MLPFVESAAMASRSIIDVSWFDLAWAGGLMLIAVGISTLPGMMTGQILAGASPLIAIRYQIVVAFMQAAAVAITTAIVTLWYRRTFFTSALQLKVPTNAAAA
jgi:putative ABC transport system permease protein